MWNPAANVRRCYAGTMTNMYGGRKGWPVTFETPTLFLDRLPGALKWNDLTGTDREDKPWLNGYPRIVFVSDMGDAWDKELPIDWLAPLLPQIAASPHQWLLLTKRPSRMRQFSLSHPFPRNVWCGTSVTSDKTLRRLDELEQVQTDGPRWVSAEPLWGRVDLVPYIGWLSWIVAGGESGEEPYPCDLDWIDEILTVAREHGKPGFAKQLGGRAKWNGLPLNLADFKGGKMEEWPERFRVRQMPEVVRG